MVTVSWEYEVRNGENEDENEMSATSRVGKRPSVSRALGTGVFGQCEKVKGSQKHFRWIISDQQRMKIEEDQTHSGCL